MGVLGKRLSRGITGLIDGIPGEIGKLNTDGSYTVRVEDTQNEVYVRLGGDPLRTVAAINNQTAYKARLPVRLRYNSSLRYEVIKVDPLPALAFLGEASGSANIPPLIGDAINLILNGDQFKPGRVRPLTGLDLQFIMEELPYPGALLGGPDTITDAATAVGTIASGKKAWIAWSVDPADNAITLTNGADVDLGTELLTADAFAITLPTDDIPLYAYAFQDGDTLPNNRPIDTMDEAYFVDLRPWLTLGSSGGGGGMTDFTVAGDSGTPQTIANGNTLTIAGGTGLSSVASATDTVTVNLDNTAVTPASYTNTALTVDAQGRITAASSGTAPVTSVSGTAPIASSGGATPAISLNDTAVTPGSYTYSSLTVDQKGRLTAASNGTAPVTSVALTAAPTGIFDVSGSPVTGSGTLALSMDNQNANIVLAGPSSGAAATPAFRALVDDDIPAALTLVAGTINNTPIGATTANTAIVSALSLLISTFKGIFTHANTADRTYTYQDVNFTVGRDSFIIAKNVSGGTVGAGQFVYFSGASSIQNAQIAGLAIANSTRDKLAQGMVRTASIANNAFGLVQIGGVFTGYGGAGGYGLNYLSDSSAGSVTATPPTAPSFIQIVGIASNSLANGDFTLLFQAPYPLLMTAATNAAAGTAGEAPQPAIGDDVRALLGNATYAAIARRQFTQTADKTIASSTAETTLFGTGQGTLTLPANALRVGTTIRISLRALYSTAGASPNVTVRAKVGGTNVCVSGTVGFAINMTNRGFYVTVEITCQTTGATGTVRAEGMGTVMTAAATGVPLSLDSTGTTTIDTTGTLAVDLTWQWGTSSASNTITSAIGLVELIG